MTGSTGDEPTDMAFSYRGRFLFVIHADAGTLSGFERILDGSLVSVGPDVPGLPLGASGLAGS